MSTSPSVTTPIVAPSEPNPWATPTEEPTSTPEPTPEPAGEAPKPIVVEITEPVPAVSNPTTPQTAELAHRVEQRARRLVFANVFVTAVTAAAVYLCTRVWWVFEMPAQQMAVPAPGGGFTTMTVNAATATLAGWKSGGQPVAVLSIAAAVVSYLGARRRSWPLAALAVAIIAPWGPGAPPRGMPASVAAPLTTGAAYTSATEALNQLRFVWWLVVLGLLVVALQTFAVSRAAKASERAEHPDEPSPLGRAVERFVSSSLTRLGVTLPPQQAPAATSSAPGQAPTGASRPAGS